MTISDYDKECDCPVCREDREIRRKLYERIHAERERMRMYPHSCIECEQEIRKKVLVDLKRWIFDSSIVDETEVTWILWKINAMLKE
jgi:hypothetical protein